MTYDAMRTEYDTGKINLKTITFGEIDLSYLADALYVAMNNCDDTELCEHFEDLYNLIDVKLEA